MHQVRDPFIITIENSPNAGRTVNCTEEKKDEDSEPDEEQLRTLWVGGIGDKVDEELLFELFLNAGPLQRVTIPRDKETKKPKAYGFIVFHHPESVEYAFNLLNGTELFGQKIRLQNKATGLGLNGRPMGAGGGGGGYNGVQQRGPHARSHTLPAASDSYGGAGQQQQWPPAPPGQMMNNWGYSGGMMMNNSYQQPAMSMMMGSHYHPADMMMSRMGGGGYPQMMTANGGHHDDRRSGGSSSGRRFNDYDSDRDRRQRDSQRDFARDSHDDRRREGGREPLPPGESGYHRGGRSSDYRDRSYDRRHGGGRDSRDYYGRR